MWRVKESDSIDLSESIGLLFALWKQAMWRVEKVDTTESSDNRLVSSALKIVDMKS